METNKKLSFEALVLGLLFLILVIVGTMGYNTFKRLNAIVETISIQAKPDNHLGIMKDILNDLYRSEISVKSYRLTKNDRYLTEFYLSAKAINKRIEHLQDFAEEGSDTMNLAVESISSLILQEYEILEALLKVKDEYRVKVALDKAMETVDRNIADFEKVSPPPVIDTLQIEQKAEEKSTFFKRIFGPSKKKKTKENTDTSLIVVATQPESIDSGINLELINLNLAELSQKETAQERQMNIRELELIKKGEIVLQQIRNLLISIEAYQMKRIEQKSKKTEELAREIKNLIGLFTIATVFLILLAAAITTNYVHKNNQYKKVLRNARKKAEELAVEKERFLATMSHEIRTPMNAIIGYTEQLLHSQLQNDQKEQLEIVKKAGNHLIQIINEVLDYSTIQAGKAILKKSNFLPHEIITDVVQLMLPTANKKNINLLYSTEAELMSVSGDSGRLRQILINLLSNAIKYTEKGEVIIHTSEKKIDNRRTQLIISISDTGVGMSAEFLKKVFEEFERADIVVDKSDPGSGLGLTIAKKLIDLHRGRIRFTSEQGKGTTVKVVLPYQISSESTKVSQPESQESRKISSLKFLVVDDVDYNRKLIGVILRRNGAYYQEAENGREAIDKMKNEKFDIILMDVHMPMIDGITATKVIKKIDEEVEIIALTASTSVKEKEEHALAGIKRTLLKPISENDLLAAIAELPIAQFQNENGKIDNKENIINLDQLWKLCQNDKVFFNEMLDTFIKTSTETIDSLKETIHENNIEQVSFLAHRLSGPTKHIGAKKLIEILNDLEHNSHNHLVFTDVKKLISSAEQELLEIIQYIKLSRNNF